MPEPTRKPKFNKPSDSFNESRWVGGIHAAEDFIENKSEYIHRIWIKKNSGNPRLYSLQKAADRRKIPVAQVENDVLDRYGHHHQGVVVFINEIPVKSWDIFKKELEALSKTPHVITVASHFEDPHNLGALVRTSVLMGVKGILLPAKNNAPLSEGTAKAAAGTLSRIDLCRPPVLETALEELRQMEYTLIGLDTNAEHHCHEYDFPKKVVLIAGGEDQGIPPYILKKCHQLLKLPMGSGANSYNASVAYSLALYEINRQKGFPF